VEGNTLQVPCVEVGESLFNATFKILPNHLWELIQATPVSETRSGARSPFQNNALKLPLVQLTDGSLWEALVQLTGQKSATGNLLFQLTGGKKLTATTDLGKVVFRIGNKTDVRRANANANSNANKDKDKDKDNGNAQNNTNNGNSGNQAPQNITAAVLKVDHIELTGKSKTMLKISGDIDLLKVINGEPQLLGEVVLPANTHISQVRLILADGSYVIADGEKYPLEIPSGEQTGLKIHGDWGVSGGQITSVQLDFNADDIRFNKVQGYRIKPTVKIANVILAEANDGEIKPETDSAIITSNSVTVSPDSEAVLKIGDSLQLTIPKGAVSETTVISGEETKTFMEYLDPATGLIRTKAGLSSIYHLQPNGIAFNTPIKVTVPYNVKALTSPEKEDKIVIFHDGDPIPSIVDKQKHTVTSEIQHFTSVVASTVDCNKEENLNIKGNDAMKYAKCMGSLFNYHVAKVDRTLAKDGYELRILGDEANGSFRTQQIEVLANTHKPPAVVAINGYNFRFDTSEQETTGYTQPTEGAHPITTLIMNKSIKNSISGSEVIMAFDNDQASNGLIPISRILKLQSSDFNANEHQWAFGSGSTILENGTCKYPGGWSDCTAKRGGICWDEPVSALGYSGETVVFLSSDHNGSQIDTFKPLCDALTNEGITDAVLLDGGGSAQLVANGVLVNPNPEYSSTGNARYVAYGIGLVRVCNEFNNSNEWDGELCRAVAFLDQTQITQTKPDFRPNANVTRGEMAAFLRRGYEYKFPNDSIAVQSCETTDGITVDLAKMVQYQKDDPKAYPYAEDIAIIMKLGFAACNTYGGYRVNSPVTRAEMAKFLVKFADSIGYKATKSCGSNYPTDISNYDSWIIEYVKRLADYGLTEKCGSSYYPENSVTREEMARFLFRLLK
jgi:exopolysaccharide biosynthesis protein